jgi:hypothetical protein
MGTRGYDEKKYPPNQGYQKFWRNFGLFRVWGFKRDKVRGAVRKNIFDL